MKLFQSIKDDKTMNGALRILFFKSYPNVHNTLHEKKKIVKKNILFVCCYFVTIPLGVFWPLIKGLP